MKHTSRPTQNKIAALNEASAFSNYSLADIAAPEKENRTLYRE